MSPIASYRLTFEERPGYLYAKIQADTIDRETALAYLGEVAAKCAELGSHRLLLDRDIPAMMSDADIFFTTKDFADMMKGKRVAFLNPYMQNTEDLNFSITIATNRGAEFHLHKDLAEAEAWLLKDPGG
jgi:hypothetical protein